MKTPAYYDDQFPQAPKWRIQSGELDATVEGPTFSEALMRALQEFQDGAGRSPKLGLLIDVCPLIDDRWIVDTEKALAEIGIAVVER